MNTQVMYILSSKLRLTAVCCSYLLVRLLTTIRDHYPHIPHCNEPIPLLVGTVAPPRYQLAAVLVDNT